MLAGKNGKRAIIYSANGVSSPVLEFGNNEQGIIAGSTLGGYFQIVKVLKGARWDTRLRSPLNELGVGAKDGDWILAVDGKPTNELANIYEALVNKAGKQVTLTLDAGEHSGKLVVPCGEMGLLPLPEGATV